MSSLMMTCDDEMEDVDGRDGRDIITRMDEGGSRLQLRST
jgi:hypothetical protein